MNNEQSEQCNFSFELQSVKIRSESEITVYNCKMEKNYFFKKFIFNISARAVTTFCDDRI